MCVANGDIRTFLTSHDSIHHTNFGPKSRNNDVCCLIVLNCIGPEYISHIVAGCHVTGSVLITNWRGRLVHSLYFQGDLEEKNTLLFWSSHHLYKFLLSWPLVLPVILSILLYMSSESDKVAHVSPLFSSPPTYYLCFTRWNNNNFYIS